MRIGVSYREVLRLLHMMAPTIPVSVVGVQLFQNNDHLRLPVTEITDNGTAAAESFSRGTRS